MAILTMRRFTCLSVALVVFGFVCANANRLAPTVSEPAFGFRLFDQVDQPDGQKLFQTRCFVCHGRNGKGDGPSAIGLAEKPQDLTDPNWQKSTADDRIRTVIQGGGVAIGKSAAMPPNPDLTEAQVAGVIAYLRSLSGGGR
jgi:cytochrome c1